QDDDWQVQFAVKCALEAVGQPTDGKLKRPVATVANVPSGLCGRSEMLGRQSPSPAVCPEVRQELAEQPPDVPALRAAGKLPDAEAVPLLVPWLKNHPWEYHAAEAAVALGRIGTPEAVAALWEAVRSEVPLKQVHISRYLQHGPRPEEYALLKGLIL